MTKNKLKPIDVSKYTVTDTGQVLKMNKEVEVIQRPTYAELEEKISILLSCKNCPDNKGGLLCQKEYEDKCLAQKIQYIKELEKENAELLCQKNRNKSCYSCANATERCFRNEIGCPCQKYKSYTEENTELKEKLEQIEKENAKLEGRLADLTSEYYELENLKNDEIALKDEEISCIQTDFNTFKSQAKELIRQLCLMVRELNKPNVQLTNVDYSLAGAEQFLSEVEK